MPRPVPVIGKLENKIIDFGRWKREALADGRIDLAEAMEGLKIANRMAAVSGNVIESVQFATRVLTGGEGMDSVSVRRQWNERQAELVQLDDYRLDNGPEAA